MMTELNVVRGILTLVLMLSFITLVVWLYSKRHQHAYDAAAQLPLEEDSSMASTPPSSGSQQS
jgi:cytochrome c oxidase cbb3-type subunit IV